MHFDAVVSKLLPLALGSIAYFAIGVIASPPTSAHPTPIRVVTNTVSAAGPSDTSPPVAEEYNDAPGDLVNTMSGNATFACNYWEKIPTEWSSLDNIIYSFQNVDPRTDVDLPSTVNTTNNLNCTDNTKVEAVFYGTVDNYKDRATIWRSSIAQHIREIVAACGGSDSFSGAKYLTNLGVEIRIFKDSCDPHSPDKRAIPAGISSVNQPSKSRQHPWEGVTTTVTATGPSDTPTLPAYDAGSRTPTRGENIIYACNYQAKIKDLSTLRAIQSLWKLEPNGDKKINTLSTPYWNETLFCKDGIRGEAYWDGGDIGQAYSESSNPLSDYAKWIDEIVEACASPSFQPFSGRKYFTTSGHSFGMYADPSCTDSVVQVPKRDVSSVQELPAHNEVGRDAGSALVAGTGSPPTTLDTVVLDATSPPAPGSDNEIAASNKGNGAVSSKDERDAPDTSSANGPTPTSLGLMIPVATGSGNSLDRSSQPQYICNTTGSDQSAYFHAQNVSASAELINADGFCLYGNAYDNAAAGVTSDRCVLVGNKTIGILPIVLCDESVQTDELGAHPNLGAVPICPQIKTDVLSVVRTCLPHAASADKQTKVPPSIGHFTWTTTISLGNDNKRTTSGTYSVRFMDRPQGYYNSPIL